MDVMDTTGPGVFAASVYNGLSIASGTNVTSANLTGLTSPKLIGDILILPVTAFAAGTGHSNAGSTSDESALVHHLFRGSWKADHPMTDNTSGMNMEPDLTKEKRESIQTNKVDDV